MADVDERVDEMINRLREQGHRVTPQRVAVLRVLAESRGHPSVEQIYEQVRANFPTTSLATIYKTVSLLKEMHEVLEICFHDHHNRYDGNKPYPHPHLICMRCGKIVDFERDDSIAVLQESVRAAGYQLVSHRVDLFGICPQCQR